MKYNEQNVKQLIETVKQYQTTLQTHDHVEIERYKQKLNRTIVYVILSVLYNKHLPSTIITDSSNARKYVEEIIGKEVADLVGFTDEQWRDWINKSVYEKQRFPYNLINKIKSLGIRNKGTF